MIIVNNKIKLVSHTHKKKKCLCLLNAFVSYEQVTTVYNSCQWKLSVFECVLKTSIQPVGILFDMIKNRKLEACY